MTSPSRLVVACFVGGSAGWALTAPGAAAGTLADAYGTGLAWVGLLGAALAAPYAALQYPGGLLVDRWGARTASVAGLTLAVVAHLVGLTAPIGLLAVTARLVAGVGYAACFAAGAELARDSGHGARGLGVFGGFALAASGGAVLVTPLVAPWWGWRAPWATTLVVTLLAVGLAWRLPRDPAARRPRRLRGRTDAARDVVHDSVLRDGQLLRLAGVHAVTLGLGLVLSSWVTTLLVTHWSFAPTAAAVTGSALLGLSVLSRPLGGIVSTRWPHRTRTVWTVTLVACGLATAALARPTVAAVAVTSVLALGVLSGLPFAGVVGAAQRRRPSRPAAAVGAMNMLAFGGVVAGTPGVGWAIDHGHETVVILALALVWVLPLAVLPTPEAAQPGTSAT
jgi:MFS family permease